MVYSWLKNMQAWWAPRLCVLCLERVPGDHALCFACAKASPQHRPACPRCAAANPSGALCGACQRRPPAFSRAFALFAYAPPIDRLLLGLKFRDQLHVARALGDLMAARLDRMPRPDMIMPVPLHVSRLRERGYNQALELARPIARRLRLPVDYCTAVRTRATTAQLLLTPSERVRNVRNAFALTRSVEGLRIALVDDVMTTGSTVNALATCLLKGGAKQVEVWVAART